MCIRDSSKVEKIMNYLKVDEESKPSTITDKFIANTLKDYASLSLKVDDFAEQLDFLNQQTVKTDPTTSDNLGIENSESAQESKLPAELVTSELVYQKLLTIENDKVDELLEELESIHPINVSIFNKEKKEIEILLITVKAVSYTHLNWERMARRLSWIGCGQVVRKIS